MRTENLILIDIIQLLYAIAALSLITAGIKKKCGVGGHSFEFIQDS